MKIKILYFSSLKDKLKKNSEEIQFEQNINVQDLINFLKEKYPEISQSFENIMIAVNEEYVDNKTELKDGDIVALIPPVSGG